MPPRRRTHKVKVLEIPQHLNHLMHPVHHHTTSTRRPATKLVLSTGITRRRRRRA